MENFPWYIICYIYRNIISFLFLASEEVKEVQQTDVMAASSFAPNFNPNMRLSSSYPTAETFAYAQYAHDTYLMATKSRPSPYSRSMDYTYRPPNIKMSYPQSAPASFGYNYDARWIRNFMKSVHRLCPVINIIIIGSHSCLQIVIVLELSDCFWKIYGKVPEYDKFKCERRCEYVTSHKWTTFYFDMTNIACI